MEFQFDKSTCKSLHKVLSRVTDQELIQEIRLPESLPDIGRVLGCWGQVILRGKEWYGGSVGVSGGIMVWVLYVPEDGSSVKSVDSWIPFQMKWDILDSQRDGMICAIPLIKTMDARSVSARKIMIRTNISVQGRAYEPRETDYYHANELPDDVQVLRQVYQLEIPVEAGEKALQIEDEIQLPTNANVCYYNLKPKISESRILGDKLLFRGVANLHVVYYDADNTMQSVDHELSFSQYTNLDSMYDTADVWIYPIVTGLELDLLGENPVIKAGLTAQYIIFDRKSLTLTEDAYSTMRNIVPENQTLNLLSKLDYMTKDLEINQKMSIQPKEIIDVLCSPAHPMSVQNADKLEVEQTAFIQVLYTDMEGNIQSAMTLGKQSWDFISDSENCADIDIIGIERPQVLYTGEEVSVTVNLRLEGVVCSENGIPMTTAIEIKESKETDPNRPSLIVRKLGANRVWDIAKKYGAKLSDMKAANGLEEACGADCVLLIPIN